MFSSMLSISRRVGINYFNHTFHKRTISKLIQQLNRGLFINIFKTDLMDVLCRTIIDSQKILHKMFFGLSELFVK